MIQSRAAIGSVGFCDPIRGLPHEPSFYTVPHRIADGSARATFV